MIIEVEGQEPKKEEVGVLSFRDSTVHSGEKVARIKVGGNETCIAYIKPDKSISLCKEMLESYGWTVEIV